MENLDKKLEGFDATITAHAKKWALPFSRFAIFVVYFWFGALKVFAVSPANPLVSALLAKTLPFLTFDMFIVAFGVWEMIIGLIFLSPRLLRLGVFLMFLHLVTTLMPLFLLCTSTWQGFMTPTLEGQYIIKNVLLIALALVLLSGMRPLDEGVKQQ